MIRLVAMDLDDTLLASDLTISMSNREMLQKAEKNGLKITLASGRMYRAMLPYAQTLGMRNIPLIAYNGALIKHTDHGRTISHRPLRRLLVDQIVSSLKELRLHVNLYSNDRVYIEKMTVEARAYMEISRVEPEIVGDFSQYTPEDCTKVLAIGDPKQIAGIKAKMAEILGERVHITISKPQYLEFVSAGVNKALALQEVAAYYGFEREEVMAIGDGFNDLEMIKWAGVGVAVDNAPLEVKEAADWVSPSCDRDGVAAALRRYVRLEAGDGD